MTVEVDTFSAVQRLWLDDPEWQKERKQQWMELASSDVFSRYRAKDIKLLKKYFLFGEVEEEYIPGRSMFMYTPFQSPEEAKLVFESGLFNQNCFDDIFGYHIFDYRSLWPMCPQYRERVEWFIDGIMGQEYELKEKTIDGRGLVCYSPEPTYWVGRYFVSTSLYFEEKPDYSGVVSTFDYFLSCLPLANKFKSRKRANKYISKIFSMAETILKDDDNQLRKEFATKLLDHREKILELWAINAHVDEEGG